MFKVYISYLKRNCTVIVEKNNTFQFQVTKLEACFTSVIFEKKIPKAKARRLAFSGYGLNFLSLPFKGDRNLCKKYSTRARFKKEDQGVIHTFIWGQMYREIELFYCSCQILT